MGDSFLSSIAWIGLANSAVSAVLVGIALAVTRWSRSTTLVSALWTLAILKLISPAFAAVPVPFLSAAWSHIEAGPSEQPLIPGEAQPGKRGTIARSELDAGPSKARTPAVQVAGAGRRPVISRETVLLALSGIWITGISFFAGLTFVRMSAMRRLVSRTDRAPEWVVREVAARCHASGVRRVPDVRMLDFALSPLVGLVGWTPVLLLPKHFYIALAGEERELLLAHEIAHLRRWDHLRAWLELIAVTLFWWNPLAWYARTRSRAAAEDCCDSWVVHWFPQRATEYAEVLLKCMELSCAPSRRLPGAMCGISRFSLTRRRLLTILHDPNPPQMSRTGSLLVATIGVFAMFAIPVVGDQTARTADLLTTSETIAGAGPFLSRPLFVDLQLHANVRLDEDFGREPNNNLKPLPRGRHKFGETEYQVGDSFILLASQMATTRPQSASGIKVGRPINSLNLLHGAAWSPDEYGVEIGSLIAHYADGETENIPIVYGVDVRDWWNIDHSKPVQRGQVVWTGANEASYRIRGNVVALRLYELSWTNPHPDRVIESIDYVSTNSSDCAPFLVAMTAEERLKAD